eukprot:m.211142 g.211142  ORF g.211142 m.211142 type:complete len:744 (+) comp25388_c0_seq1:25-2256(+)
MPHNLEAMLMRPLAVFTAAVLWAAPVMALDISSVTSGGPMLYVMIAAVVVVIFVAIACCCVCRASRNKHRPDRRASRRGVSVRHVAESPNICTTTTSAAWNPPTTTTAGDEIRLSKQRSSKKRPSLPQLKAGVTSFPRASMTDESGQAYNDPKELYGFQESAEGSKPPAPKSAWTVNALPSQECRDSIKPMQQQPQPDMVQNNEYGNMPPPAKVERERSSRALFTVPPPPLAPQAPRRGSATTVTRNNATAASNEAYINFDHDESVTDPPQYENLPPPPPLEPRVTPPPTEAPEYQNVPPRRSTADHMYTNATVTPTPRTQNSSDIALVHHHSNNDDDTDMADRRIRVSSIALQAAVAASRRSSSRRSSSAAQAARAHSVLNAQADEHERAKAERQRQLGLTSSSTSSIKERPPVAPRSPSIHNAATSPRPSSSSSQQTSVRRAWDGDADTGIAGGGGGGNRAPPRRTSSIASIAEQAAAQSRARRATLDNIGAVAVTRRASTLSRVQTTRTPVPMDAMYDNPTANASIRATADGFDEGHDAPHTLPPPPSPPVMHGIGGEFLPPPPPPPGPADHDSDLILPPPPPRRRTGSNATVGQPPRRSRRGTDTVVQSARASGRRSELGGATAAASAPDVTTLIDEMRRLGNPDNMGRIAVTLGTLVSQGGCPPDALPVLCRQARQRHLVNYTGDELVPGRDDTVVLTVVAKGLGGLFREMSTHQLTPPGSRRSSRACRTSNGSSTHA